MKRPATVFILLSLVLMFSLPVPALTGSGVSPVTALETVSPAVQSATALTERSLSVTFSEPLLAPGATAPGNYTVSGPGLGTLSPVPDGVTGSGPHTLTWTAGEMRDGAAVTVTVSGVQDAVGNPLLPASATASASGMGVAPVFTALSVTPSSASAGDTVTITFTASEPLDGDPVVTVNGHPAAWVSGAKAVNFVYTYTVGEEDAPGPAVVAVSGTDPAGNLGSLEDTLALTITEAEAGLPVRAWPLALLLGGIMVLVARRRMIGSLCGNVDAPSWRVLLGQRQPKKAAGSRFYIGRGNVNAPSRRALHGDGPNAPSKKKSLWRFFLFLAAVLAAQTAFAAPPAVSNVAMVQRDNGAGSTEAVITYDLDAPNGPCDITVSLSKDGGADGYVFPMTSVTGDLSGVAGGAGRQIVWDLRADYPEEALPNARIRLTADDGLVQHTLTYTAGPGGSITGDSPQTVDDGADGTAVTAVPDAGHHFVQWSDGVLTATRQDMAVTGDITVTAAFAINTYTLTYTAGANGTITGDSPQVVNHGADGMAVTAVPDGGYAFSQWSDGVLTAARTDTNVTADLTVTASFAPLPVVTAFAINSGAATTMPLGVTLDNTATEGPTEYMASEAATFTGASWQAYGTSPAFTLSFGVGTRTVYFKTRNAYGESGVVSDTIFLVPNTVPVAAGTFPMGRTSAGDDATYGTPPELPVHAVTLGSHSLGTFEVTNKEYCDVLNWALAQGYLWTFTGESWTGTDHIFAGGASARYLIVDPVNAQCNVQYSGGLFTPKTRVGLPGATNYSMDTHPMTTVSWHGAVAYCNWLSEWQGLTPCYDMTVANWPLTVAPPTAGGYRLPTEAEWERAAAWDGTKHWVYGFMSDTNPAGTADRCNDNNGYFPLDNPLGLTTMPNTSPVGWFNGVNVSPNGGVTTVDSPSPAGAYDMSGNVLEWCGDWYSGTYYSTSPANNPTGPATGTHRVMRGGSFFSTFFVCRSAARGGENPVIPSSVNGFRVSRTEVTQHTLTYTAGANGTITGDSPQVVTHGADGTAVTAVPDGGNYFVQWSDGVLTATRTDTNVTADLTVTAVFVAVTTVTSFAINGGAATTMPLGVTLDNTATGSPVEYMASESATFAGASWQAYGTSPAFMLSFGVGRRTVYFKVRTSALVESGVVSDTIFLVPNTVPVAAGTFDMGRTSAGDDAGYGSNFELPVHAVTLGAYTLGKHEVTNKEYCDVLNWALAQGYLLDSAGAAWTGTGDIYAGGASSRYLIVAITQTDCNIQYAGGVFTSKTRVGLPGTTNYSMDMHPMVRVSWFGSVAYCNWLSMWQGLTPCYAMGAANWPLLVSPTTAAGYRLPTEAEWERAAAWDGVKHWIYGFMSDTNASGTRNRCNDFNFGTSDNPLGLTAWPYTSPVGWFNGVNVSPNGSVTTVNSPSPVGAYDMSGNVGEWCGDWYLDTYYTSGGPPWTNPTGPATGTNRVLRSGSWRSSFYACRSALRLSNVPGGTDYGSGFRVSRVPLPPVVTSFAINSGAATTDTLVVTLDNTATGSLVEYMASESATFTGASWQAYGTSPAFMLSFGVGTRTVYFKVRTSEMAESGVVSDTIFLVPNTVPVAAGTFSMGRTSAGDDAVHGQPEELPLHSVTLGAYTLGKHEVTNKEYCDVLNWARSQGYLLTSAGAAWTGTGDIYAGGASARYLVVAITQATCNIQYSGGVFTSKTRVGLPGTTNYSMDMHPMVRLTWYGAVAYCTWLSEWQGLTPCYNMGAANWPLTVAPPTSGGYRLPTEAEWERAAGWDGVKHWIYGFMSDTNASGTANRCNDNNSFDTYDNPLGLTTQPYTSPVGWFNGTNVSPNGGVTTVNSPSPVGAYDMSGNVWEWCGDWYLDTYYTSGGPPWTNPTGPATGSYRAFRGGGWDYNFHYCRAAYRGRTTPTNMSGGIGFRVSRTQ